MMKILMLVLALAYASAFAPVAPARAAGVASRSDSLVMAAKKKGVNPALFATGITKKAPATRGAGRKSFRDMSPKLNAGAAAGMWVAGKPWLEGQKAESQKVGKFRALSGSLGSKDRPGGGAGVFFLGGGRSH